MKKRKKLVSIIILIILVLHGPLAGVCLQTVVSAGSYIGMCVGSVFNKQIREDMLNIKYNPFNSSEIATLQSNKVSFYKGVPIYRMNYNRSGSFCLILLYKGEGIDEEAVNTVKHEYGHTFQQMILGPGTYLAMVGVPSFFELSKRSYYDRPWEIMADVFGRVSVNHHASADIKRGWAYLIISAITGPFGYFFLIGEY